MAIREPISIERRQELVQTRTATINGKPALISGWNNDFATVADIDTWLSCEFAWPTVDHIVTNKNGAFKS